MRHFFFNRYQESKKQLARLAAAAGFAAALVAGTASSEAFGGVIYDPVNATASSTLYNNPIFRGPQYTIDASGLTGATYPTGSLVPATWATQDTNAGNMYLSVAGDVTPTLTFDLGGLFNLAGLHLWNYNEATLGFFDRGIKTADVSFSTDGGVTYSTPLLMTFQEADGTNTDTGVSYWFSQVNADFVKIQALSNYGDNSYTGISEIRFMTPEPASLVLCGLSAIGLLAAAWRRRRASSRAADSL